VNHQTRSPSNPVRLNPPWSAGFSQHNSTQPRPISSTRRCNPKGKEPRHSVVRETGYARQKNWLRSPKAHRAENSSYWRRRLPGIPKTVSGSRKSAAKSRTEAPRPPSIPAAKSTKTPPGPRAGINRKRDPSAATDEMAVAACFLLANEDRGAAQRLITSTPRCFYVGQQWPTVARTIARHLARDS
jgi:hypothetical protein